MIQIILIIDNFSNKKNVLSLAATRNRSNEFTTIFYTLSRHVSLDDRNANAGELINV